MGLRLGLFPAMIKPTARYLVTYQDGSKEFIYTRYTLKIVLKTGKVVKIEKKKTIIKLLGDTKEDFKEVDLTDWHDVSKYYLP